MNKKLILIVALVLITACVITSCSNKNIDESKLISVSVTYKGIATANDFEKYHNVYSPYTEIKLERENYYLIKVLCTVSNDSSKNLSGLDFVTYSDKYVLYEADAIDIEPTYPIAPNSCESFEAYIYVDKSLDTEEKIINKLADTNFKFEAYLYKDIPLDKYSTKINFQSSNG